MARTAPGESPSNFAEPPTVDRRRRGIVRTLAGACLGIGLAALGLTGGLWTAATARFLFPNVLPRRPERFKIGPPTAYPLGRVETKYQEPWGVWVVHGSYQGQQQIVALRTACTHLGCITTWQEAEQKFKCPCHGSGFSREGINQEGPAPRPLERYAIRLVEDGQLEIDTSRIFQQELGHWSDPRSFVPV